MATTTNLTGENAHRRGEEVKGCKNYCFRLILTFGLYHATKYSVKRHNLHTSQHAITSVNVVHYILWVFSLVLQVSQSFG
jgi:hypothetical protein